MNSYLSANSQQLFTNCSLAIHPMFVAETLAFIIGVSVAFAFCFYILVGGMRGRHKLIHRFFHRLWIKSDWSLFGQERAPACAGAFR